MDIRESEEEDNGNIYKVEREAFGTEIEPNLVMELLDDSSARPFLSLIALNGKETIGHLLFTSANIEGEQDDISISILGPLAVLPDHQRKGIGKKLVERGLNILKERGVDLVFVAGHPEYYPKFGFSPAGKLGFEAPYPIPEKDADAWMVLDLRSGLIGNVSGKISCADALDKPMYWEE